MPATTTTRAAATAAARIGAIWPNRPTRSAGPVSGARSWATSGLPAMIEATPPRTTTAPPTANAPPLIRAARPPGAATGRCPATAYPRSRTTRPGPDRKSPHDDLSREEPRVDYTAGRDTAATGCMARDPHGGRSRWGPMVGSGGPAAGRRRAGAGGRPTCPISATRVRQRPWARR